MNLTDNALKKIDQFINSTSGQPLPGYAFSSVNDEDVTDNKYLIKGVIGQGDLAVLFGESGSMKSFVATDMAFHIAAGLPWQNKKIRQSGVLVVIGEGQAGYKKRIKAVIQKHGRHDVPIWIVPEPVALDTEAEVLRAWILKAEAELGCRIDLVLMDTFSLMLGSGDESNNADVSNAFSNLRQSLENRSALLIHHVGHNANDRERGAYQIRANVDVRMRVDRSRDLITLTCLKSKDDQPFDPINLGFEVITLGVDEDGDQVTSLVIVEASQADVDAILKSAARKLSKPEQTVIDALAVVLSRQSHCHDDDLRAEVYNSQGLTKSDNAEARKKAFHRAVGGLLNRGRIERDSNGCYRIAREPDDEI